jgi:starch synthase
MVGALAKFVAKAGHNVDFVSPLYTGIRERFPGLKRFDWNLSLSLGADVVSGEIWTLSPMPGLTLYFVDQPDFFLRPQLYQEQGKDYPDNAARFIFLSKACVNLARYAATPPDVIHVHDWQTAVVPLLVRHEKLRTGWNSAPPTCLTIHNLAYQGVFPAAQYELTNLPADYYQPAGAEFYGQFNCLKTGIIYADQLTTVSPRYAREITTPALGCGLDGVLRSRQSDLAGILNGLDLQREVGLPPNAEVPLFGTITRLVSQKGVDLLLGALEEMLAANLQFVLLGSGAPVYEKAFRDLAARHRPKVAVKIGFDQPLSHRIEAGCDFYLMPSRFEPCGLNQMYSLRYGTIPIVHRTGGLDDSVIDPTEDSVHANGIKFSETSIRALAKAVRKALVLFQDQALLNHFRQNAMRADFSWERVARDYLKVYQGMTLGPSPALARL